MALSEKHRSSIYLSLVPVLGEEEAQAMVSQFPARDLDEPISREYLRAELADLRADLRSEFHGEIGGLRAELHSEIGRVLERMRLQAMWATGVMLTGLVGGMGVAAAIARVVG